MYTSPPHPPSTILNLELLLSKYTIHLVTIKNWVLLPLMSYNRYKKIINMYTLSYSHSLHANTGSEGSTHCAGGPGYPKSIHDLHRTPECPGWGPAPGASPGLGRVMGGTDQLPQFCCAGQAGCPVGGVGVSLGRELPSCALADLQGQMLAPGSKSPKIGAVTRVLALLGGTQHATAPAGPSLGPHMLLQHNSYP